MIATLEDWKNGFGVGLALAPSEIDALVAQLLRLKSDPDQHFHISADDHTGAGGVGSIEVYVDREAVNGDMRISSLAKGPGESI